jgi:hypothetical protein
MSLGRVPGGGRFHLSTGGADCLRCSTCLPRSSVRRMAQPVQTRSGHCLGQGHASCPHFAGLHGMPPLWRPWQWRRAKLTYGVCDCDCHAACPLARRVTVSQQEWREGCTCPGAIPVREAQERADELKHDLAVVTGEMRSAGGWDAEELERRLSEVYRSHGEAVPPGLAGWSRLRSAANARKGTRIPRLLWMAGRGIGGVVSWAWERPSEVDAQAEHNRSQSRAGFRSVGAMAAVAAIVTLAASRSSGLTRRLGIGGAVVLWLATGWAGLLVTGATALSRLADRTPDPTASERDGELGRPSGASGDRTRRP